MVVFAKEPPDVNAHASFREHIACLFEKDGWVFSLIYGVTFGGFIGLTTFLPSYYYDQFGVSKVQAGQLTMLAAFMGAAVRVVGGWISDRWGGVNTLTVVLLVVAVSLVLVGFSSGSLAAHHAAADRLLRRTGRGQRRAVPAGAAALAYEHGGGRLDDRRDRRAGRRPGAQRHGPVQAIPGQLHLGLRVLRGAVAGDAGRDARDADPLDPHLGRKRAAVHASRRRTQLPHIRKTARS